MKECRNAKKHGTKETMKRHLDESLDKKAKHCFDFSWEHTWSGDSTRVHETPLKEQAVLIWGTNKF